MKQRSERRLAKDQVVLSLLNKLKDRADQMGGAAANAEPTKLLKQAIEVTSTAIAQQSDPQPTEQASDEPNP